MIGDDIIRVARECATIIKTQFRYLWFSRRLLDTSKVGENYSYRERYAHMLWCCERIVAFVLSGDIGKANRWLGWIQGVMWAGGLQTIDEQRALNRGGKAEP